MKLDRTPDKDYVYSLESFDSFVCSHSMQHTSNLRVPECLHAVQPASNRHLYNLEPSYKYTTSKVGELKRSLLHATFEGNFTLQTPTRRLTPTGAHRHEEGYTEVSALQR
jgi:hypothetical protein